MLKQAWILWLLLTSSTVAGLEVGDIRYRVSTLSGDTGRPDVQDLNDFAQVVGRYQDEGAFWDPVLGRINLGHGIWAWGISEDAEIVGVDNSQSGSNRAVRWTAAGGMVELNHDAAGFVASWATAINNDHSVVGWAAPPAEGVTNAFLWRFDDVTVLPDLRGGQNFAVAWDINDLGWIAGASIGWQGDGPVIWTPERTIVSLGDLRPGPGSSGEAYAINNRAQVVGISANEPEDEAFLWTPQAGMIGLGHVTDGWTAAYDVNNHEQVVGVAFSWTTYTAYGFVWDRRRGMRLLNDLLDPCTGSGTGFDIGVTFAINDLGQIAANAVSMAPAMLLTPYIPGDLDEDADCDLQDLAYQLANFGRTEGATYAAGDLDCDQDVDLEDLSILLSNFGETLP